MRPPIFLLLVLAACGMPAIEPEPAFSVEYWQADWPFADGTYEQRWRVQLHANMPHDQLYYNSEPAEFPWCPDSINAHVYHPIDIEADHHIFTMNGISVQAKFGDGTD